MQKFTFIIPIFMLFFSCSTVPPYYVSNNDDAKIIIRRVDDYNNIDIVVRIQYDCFDYQLNTKSWPGKEFRVSQSLLDTVFFGAKGGNYRIGAYLNDNNNSIYSLVMDFKIKYQIFKKNNDQYVFDIKYVPADPNHMNSKPKIQISQGKS